MIDTGTESLSRSWPLRPIDTLNKVVQPLSETSPTLDLSFPAHARFHFAGSGKLELRIPLIKIQSRGYYPYGKRNAQYILNVTGKRNRPEFG